MAGQEKGRRLIFADGSEYENAEAGYSDGVLVLFMKNTVTFAEAAAICMNSAKTQTIVFEYGEMSKTYDDFTHVVNILESPDGEITISLKRGE